MARVPYLDRSELPPEYRDLLDRPLNLLRAMVNNPAATRALSHTARYVRFGSKLDPRLRELAIIQVGYLTRTPYEYCHHVKAGLDCGVSEDDIRAIAAETEGRGSTLDPLAKTVLKAAREMTTDGAMSEATFAALRERLGKESLIDLVLAIAFYNAVVRILGTLQIDVEDDYLPYLKRFPLPSDTRPALP